MYEVRFAFRHIWSSGNYIGGYHGIQSMKMVYGQKLDIMYDVHYSIHNNYIENCCASGLGLANVQLLTPPFRSI